MKKIGEVFLFFGCNAPFGFLNRCAGVQQNFRVAWGYLRGFRGLKNEEEGYILALNAKGGRDKLICGIPVKAMHPRVSNEEICLL